MRQTGELWAVMAGGLLAGVLDITYAIVMALLRDSTAERLLQSVASGLFGKAAFEGGFTMAIAGLMLHLVILLVAAAIYAVVSRRFIWLRQHVLLAGTIFGVLVYLFMNFVVLPLSAVPFQLSYPPLTLLKGFASHALLVGIPIAGCLHLFARSQRR